MEQLKRHGSFFQQYRVSVSYYIYFIPYWKIAYLKLDEIGGIIFISFLSEEKRREILLENREDLKDWESFFLVSACCFCPEATKKEEAETKMTVERRQGERAVIHHHHQCRRDTWGKTHFTWKSHFLHVEEISIYTCSSIPSSSFHFLFSFSHSKSRLSMKHKSCSKRIKR